MQTLNTQHDIKDSKVIAIDFDGSCVACAYPCVGKDIGAVPILRELVEKGHKLILYTLRDGKDLEKAINWLDKNNIKLHSVQRNPLQTEMRYESNWRFNSPKCAFDFCIDDRNIGTPLIYPGVDTWSLFKEEPYIDWVRMRELLRLKNLL